MIETTPSHHTAFPAPTVRPRKPYAPSTGRGSFADQFGQALKAVDHRQEPVHNQSAERTPVRPSKADPNQDTHVYQGKDQPHTRKDHIGSHDHAQPARITHESGKQEAGATSEQSPQGDHAQQVDELVTDEPQPVDQVEALKALLSQGVVETNEPARIQSQESEAAIPLIDSQDIPTLSTDSQIDTFGAIEADRPVPGVGESTPVDTVSKLTATEVPALPVPPATLIGNGATPTQTGEGEANTTPFLSTPPVTEAPATESLLGDSPSPLTVDGQTQVGSDQPEQLEIPQGVKIPQDSTKSQGKATISEAGTAHGNGEVQMMTTSQTLPEDTQGQALPAGKEHTEPAQPAPTAGAIKASDPAPTQVVGIGQAQPTQPTTAANTPAANAAPAQPQVPQAPTPAQQLASALGSLRRRGDGSYATEITLNPKELGQVRLQVHVSGNTVNMLANAVDPATRALLDAGLNDLRQALVDAGLEGGQLDVGQGDTSDQGEQNSSAGYTTTGGVQVVDAEELSIPATLADYITSTGVNTLA